MFKKLKEQGCYQLRYSDHKRTSRDEPGEDAYKCSDAETS
jgi:hypothetical protein